MSRRSFGELIGLGDGKLSTSLGGRRRCTAEELRRIADFSGTTVDRLLTGRGREPRAERSIPTEQTGLRTA